MNRLTKNQKKKLHELHKNGETQVEIKFPLSKERDERIQQKRDLEKARLIWDKWKKQITSIAQPIEQIPILLNELCAEMEKHIQSQKLREYIVKTLVEPKIALLYGAAASVKMMLVDLQVDCPHQRVTETGLGQCGFSAIVTIPRQAWIEKSFHHICPECEGRIDPEYCKEIV